MAKQKWLHRLGLVSLFLTILTVVITVTINAYPLYVWDIGRLDILDWVDVSKDTLLLNYRELMRYLNNPFVTKLVLPDFPVSDSGAFHFYEVKKLFMLNYGVLLVTIIPTAVYVKQLVKQRRLWQLVRPFQFAAVIPLILGFIMAIGFDAFFTAFHGVFFNNDAWIFDPATDPIINALPQEYFMHCFILAFVLFELVLLVGIYLGKREMRRNIEVYKKDASES